LIEIKGTGRPNSLNAVEATFRHMEMTNKAALPVLYTRLYISMLFVLQMMQFL